MVSKVLFLSFMLFVLLFSGCGESSSTNESGSISLATDNELNNWSVLDSYGYSGGNVLFVGILAVGEWQVFRSKDNSGEDSSYSMLSGAKLDKYGRHYKYKLDLVYGNSGWVSSGSYGLSRDGLTLNVNHILYSYKEIINNATGYCIVAMESTTTDEYTFCKVSN
ncbi:MAG: hypothetical protein WBK95_10745 [Sulfurimonas sp.]|nr:hypothetical protein [Sulfurimonas sp.]MDD5202875.1 hypothetical protein [Sulfurimonas sp.]